jgi:hypothetical protein
MTDRPERSEYVSALRTLADLIEQHDELPVPYGIDAQWIDCALSHEDQRRSAQAFVRAVPGPVTKGVRDSAFDLDGEIGPIRVAMILSRDAVCTRVVRKVREVTEEVPDPEALAAVPTVTVTKTVEDIEWVCEPLMRSREELMAEAANDSHLDNYDPAIDAPGADDYLVDVTA